MYFKSLLGWLPAHPGARIWLALFFASGVFITVSRNEVLSPWPFVDRASGDLPANEMFEIPSVPKGRVGPWGELEVEKLALQNYDDMFPEGSGQLATPEWVFENLKREELIKLLESAHLTAQERSVLLETNRWDRCTNGFVLRPPDELVAGLGAVSKQVLYPVLGQSYRNTPQYLCYRFPLDGFESHFADSGIPSRKLAVLRSMTYTNENTLCLAVDRSVQGKLTTPEFDKLLRTLFTVRTWRISLRVTPDSDIDALVRYWGRGGREQTIRPLLESMARQPNGGRLNISYFLPPFVRMRLYTYPYAYSGDEVLQEDCFFTARYFFRQETTDPQSEGGLNSADQLLTRCEGVEDTLRFGDYLLVLDAKGTPIHVCVYLADDFVYTKNGTGIAKPWVIMKLKEMVDDYAKSKPLRIVHMRPKVS